MGTTEHYDPDFLTILLQDHHTVSGLQVLHQNQWVDVPPSRSTFNVNIGDLLQAKSLPSTYAFILRNEREDCEGGRAGHAADLDPQQAEAIGILQTSVWVKEKQIQNFNIEGDCESLFNYINGHNADISWPAKAYEGSKQISATLYQFFGFCLCS
ncbi:1-aminocyclopropane-1-carboxylate oxidase-like [Papaver somniferum]|uniref:1-aminocyclopropane-1-carboxylate oxidase-like n=1 Tax=Papaver somniferum TaxID=3469 RepID=UPI000E6F52C3|nr:1-aminocyclopropane-1-carboxylate oxidase-like [Papaver somniferum]